MTRRSNAQGELLTARVTVRLSEREYQVLTALAKATGKPISEIVRQDVDFDALRDTLDLLVGPSGLLSS